MRTIVLIFAFWCVGHSALSQALKDTVLYNPGLLLLQKASTAQEYVKAAEYFTSTGVNQWPVSYYAALAYIHASMKTQEDKEKDQLLDKAQNLINAAFKLRPDESELFALQAFLYQARIQVSPELRGMNYSGKAEASLKKAVAANQANPRAWSLIGYNLSFTPGIFGGGPEKALPLFEKAKGKFIVFKPLLPFMPMWGEPENQQMIAECKKVKN